MIWEPPAVCFFFSLLPVQLLCSVFVGSYKNLFPDGLSCGNFPGSLFRNVEDFIAPYFFSGSISDILLISVPESHLVYKLLSVVPQPKI